MGTAQVEELVDSNKRLATELLAANTKIASLESVRDSLANDVERLQNQNRNGDTVLKQTRTDLQYVTRERDNAVSALKLVTEDRGQIVDKLNAAQDTIEALTAKCNIVSQSNIKLLDENAGLSRELHDQKAMFDEMVREGFDEAVLVEAIEKLVRTIADIRAEVERRMPSPWSLHAPYTELEVAVMLPKLFRLIWSRMDGAW